MRSADSAIVEPRPVARPDGPCPLLIKICGLKTPEALDVALDAGADMVGFVFFPPSPRHVGFEAARALGERVRGRARKVALSVDANDDELAAIIEALKPDMLQLHGKETPERVVVVRTRFGLPVMKALPIAERSDLVADPALRQGRRPPDLRRARAARRDAAGRPRQALRLAAAARTSTPAFRSCSRAASMPAMSREALRITAAPGVDVSSGVERAPGEKDPDKIRAFIRAARAADGAAPAAANRSMSSA